MERSIEEIGRKLDALGLWDALVACNFAIRPRGTVFPYFCTALSGEQPALKVRLLMLEGWQTFHDYLRGRADRFFGVASTPVELSHFELLFLQTGEFKAFRYDAGYMPREVESRELPLVAKLLWEVYGLMLRLESDRQLPLRYAAEQAVFARVESAPDVWEDAPLAIVQPQPYVEKVQFDREMLRKAGDLPLAEDETLVVDFRMLPNVATREARPRCLYELSMVDAATKADRFRERTSVVPAVGLKGMWESMPSQVLGNLLKLGRIPRQVHCPSPRVFRFLRPLCVELPIKLSISGE